MPRPDLARQVVGPPTTSASHLIATRRTAGEPGTSAPGTSAPRASAPPVTSARTTELTRRMGVAHPTRPAPSLGTDR